MRVKIDRAVNLVIITTGVSSVVTQLLTIREFLAQFTGNEFTIALIFFCWLMLGGAGALLAYALTRRFFRPSASGLAWLSIAAALLSPLQLLWIRLLRDTVFIHGAAIGFYQIFGYAALTTAPYCLLIGFVLPYSLFVIRQRIPAYPGTLAYIADNIGDATGGALFSFLLVFIVTPLQAALIAGLLLLAATGLLLAATPTDGQANARADNRRRKTIFIPLLFIAAGLLFLFAGIEADTLSTDADGKLVAYQETRYGRLTVLKNADQHTIFFDGLPLAGSQNIQSVEETVHYPLLQTERPENILFISAIPGIIREIEKYRPRRIDYLEINPGVTRTMFRFGLLEKNNRINIFHQDARPYLMASTRKYDAIIMCLPEPTTFQLNRFYTDRFFDLVKSRLSENGVFAFSLDGFDSYLSETARKKISVIYHTLQPAFKHIQLIPGGRIYFVCADHPISLQIPQLLHERNIDTKYLAGFFDGDITPDKTDYLNSLINTDTPINRDLAPALMRLELADWFFQYSQSPRAFFVTVGLIMLLYIGWRPAREFVLFSTGFAAMGLEILTIFAFQIFFGYIYFQIGVIVTVFLAGLLPGAWFGQKTGNNPRRMAQMLDVALILLMALFVAAITVMGRYIPVAAYLFFGFCASCICGFQFPTILRWAGDNNKQTTGAFSADLVGAAAGALVVSTLLIPYLGIAGAGVALMLLKAASLIAVRKTS